MIERLSSALLGATVLAGLATPAAALNTRTWVSGTGSDTAGCGPIQTPCRSLQYAHDNTAASGEIDVKDSAGYGSVVITKAISIVGTGSLAGVLATNGGVAITINAGASDRVVLRGLTIEGAGVGAAGIVFNRGGALDIADCSVQNFAATAPSLPDYGGTGILMMPTSGSPRIRISRTDISNNLGVGVWYYPQSGNAAANIEIDNVSATSSSGSGIAIIGRNSSGATAATIVNSYVAHNTYGIYVSGSVTKVAIELCTAASNSNHGIESYTGTVTVGRTVASNNGQYGLYNTSGTILSFKNNELSGNASGPTSGTIGAATFY